MHYKLAKGVNAESMVREVNRLIQEGYEPIGTPTITVSVTGYTFHTQAMIKKDLKPHIKSGA